MARYEFRLPDVGEGVAEAEVVEWHVAIGDAVAEGQPIAAIMTQKATIELEAPVTGTIVERYGEVGETLPVGALLVAFETAGEADQEGAALPAEDPRPATVPLAAGDASAEPSAQRTGDSKGRRLASPAVRQRASTLGIELADVVAVGDRVTHADLDRHIVQKQSEGYGQAMSKLPGGVEIPVLGMRRQIAHHMQEAKRRIPHFTYVEEVDVSTLEGIREGLNADAANELHLSFLPFLVVATCRAIKNHPSLNARYDDQREVLIQYDAIHIGIATQTDRGLTVPVLRDADRLNLWQIAQAIARLAEGARTGKLRVDEMHGSTITITSLGKLGGIVAVPIINWPEVAILAPSRIVERPVWLDGCMEPRKILHISISCDHRVIDGALAAAFVQDIKRELETFDGGAIGLPTV